MLVLVAFVALLSCAFGFLYLKKRFRSVAHDCPTQNGIQTARTAYLIKRFYRNSGRTKCGIVTEAHPSAFGLVEDETLYSVRSCCADKAIAAAESYAQQKGIVLGKTPLGSDAD